MTYRKFKADYLFDGKELTGPDRVLITNDEGIVQDVVPAAAAGDGVVYYPGLLSPGFVNCHCHLELSHMKGVIPEGTGLVDFLSTVIRRRGEAAAAGGAGGAARSGLADAIAAGEQEMLDNGIVAVGDICNTADTVFQKHKSRLLYRNFVETIGFVEQGAPARFEQSLAIRDAFGSGSTIVPHAPYSVSPALFRLIAAQGAGSVFSMHNQETEAENEFLMTGKGDFLRLYAQLGLDVGFFKGTGSRSMQAALNFFKEGQTMILVHNVATMEEDLAPESGGVSGTGISGTGGPKLYFCLCPNANLYISGQLPDVPMLLRHGSDIVIGTDSLASNHGLSVLEELKTLHRAFPELPLRILLSWATANGAEALGMEGKVGRFLPGRRPGVLLLRGLEDGRLAAETAVERLL